MIIAVVTLCGSIYLILGTNLGARLGFLVTLTGLAGWMFLMGIIWAVYGIGLQGPGAVVGRRARAHRAAGHRRAVQAGVFDEPRRGPRGRDVPEEAEIVAEQFVDEGWATITEEEPSFGQAVSAAGVFLEETGAFAAGEFQAVNVFDTGGDRFPKIGELRLPRLLARAALRRRRGRRPRADAHRARSGAAPRGRSTRPASASTSTWSATSAPGASRRSC